MAYKPIYDIYIRYISIVERDRRKTVDALTVYINKCIIQDKLDDYFGLLDNLKVPQMCRRHDGNTYIAFCRFEMPDLHDEAAEYLSQLIFRGRQLLARANDIESGVAQWSTVKVHDEDGTPLWYHGEKTKLLNTINRVVESNENQLEEISEQLEYEREVKALALNKISTLQEALDKLNRKYGALKDEKEELLQLVCSLKLQLGEYESNGNSDEPRN